MKITKSELKGLIKEELLEAFGLEIPIDKKEASAPQLGLMKLKEEVDVERTSEDLLVLRLPGSDARSVLNKEQAIDLARKIIEAFPNENY
jgi:hypothetical protein|tara:strand:- start:601 stop:870 length:270 start_codon:yes stop_codon:yes gene_type:complete